MPQTPKEHHALQESIKKQIRAAARKDHKMRRISTRRMNDILREHAPSN